MSSLILPATTSSAARSATTDEPRETECVELTAVVSTGGPTTAEEQPVKQKPNNGQLALVITDDQPNQKTVSSWAHRVADVYDQPTLYSTVATNTLCAFSFAPKSTMLSFMGMGSSSRQCVAKELDTIGTAIVDDIVKCHPQPSPVAGETSTATKKLRVVQHVDSASRSLENAIASYTPSPSSRADGDVDLIIVPHSQSSMWTSWLSRSAQEGFLRTNEIATPAARKTPTSVLLCKKEIINKTSTALYDASNAAKMGITALACVNLKHFRERVPETAKRLAQSVLKQGDTLYLFAHIEMPTMADSMYATDGQWTHNIKDLLDTANAQLKELTEHVQQAYPHLKVGAIKSENTLIPGLQHAVEKHNVSVIGVGRGARSKLFGTTIHTVMSSFRREQYEAVVSSVDVPAVLLV